MADAGSGKPLPSYLRPTSSSQSRASRSKTPRTPRSPRASSAAAATSSSGSQQLRRPEIGAVAAKRASARKARKDEAGPSERPKPSGAKEAKGVKRVKEPTYQSPYKQVTLTSKLQRPRTTPSSSVTKKNKQASSRQFKRDSSSTTQVGSSALSEAQRLAAIARLTSFYEIYNPAKLDKAAATIDRFSHKLDALWKLLEEKYVVNPASSNGGDACMAVACSEAGVDASEAAGSPSRRNLLQLYTAVEEAVGEDAAALDCQNGPVLGNQAPKASPVTVASSPTKAMPGGPITDSPPAPEPSAFGVSQALCSSPAPPVIHRRGGGGGGRSGLLLRLEERLDTLAAVRPGALPGYWKQALFQAWPPALHCANEASTTVAQ